MQGGMQGGMHGGMQGGMHRGMQGGMHRGMQGCLPDLMQGYHGNGYMPDDVSGGMDVDDTSSMGTTSRMKSDHCRQRSDSSDGNRRHKKHKKDKQIRKSHRGRAYHDSAKKKGKSKGSNKHRQSSNSSSGASSDSNKDNVTDDDMAFPFNCLRLGGVWLHPTEPGYAKKAYPDKSKLKIIRACPGPAIEQLNDSLCGDGMTPEVIDKIMFILTNKGPNTRLIKYQHLGSEKSRTRKDFKQAMVREAKRLGQQQTPPVPTRLELASSLAAQSGLDIMELISTVATQLKWEDAVADLDPEIKHTAPTFRLDPADAKEGVERFVIHHQSKVKLKVPWDCKLEYSDNCFWLASSQWPERIAASEYLRLQPPPKSTPDMIGQLPGQTQLTLQPAARPSTAHGGLSLLNNALVLQSASMKLGHDVPSAAALPAPFTLDQQQHSHDTAALAASAAAHAQQQLSHAQQQLSARVTAQPHHHVQSPSLALLQQQSLVHLQAAHAQHQSAQTALLTQNALAESMNQAQPQSQHHHALLNVG